MDCHYMRHWFTIIVIIVILIIMIIVIDTHTFHETLTGASYYLGIYTSDTRSHVVISHCQRLKEPIWKNKDMNVC